MMRGIVNSRGMLVSIGLLVTVSVAACSAHNAAEPPGSPAATTPLASPVASPAAPLSGAAPCPSDSGWTGQNLSTAPPNPAAWLTPDQMPAPAVYHWTAQGTAHAEAFAQDMWNALYTVGANDFQAWQVQSYQGSNVESASQTIFLYSTGAQAACGYQSAVAAAAGNQAESRSIQASYGITQDAVTTETVSGQHDSAWTESWTGPSIPPVAHGPQTDVEYMAQVGTALTFVSFVVPGLHEGIPDAAAAQAVLSTMMQHLSVYQDAS